MITLFNCIVNPGEYNDPDTVSLTYIEGDIDLSQPTSRLRYAMVGSQEVYSIKLKYNELIDSSSNDMLSVVEKTDILKSKLKPKIANGFWFNLPISSIINGAESLTTRTFYTYDKLPSIGFGATKEDAYKDALNRTSKKVLFAYEKGTITLKGNINTSTLPYFRDIKVISGTELRKYLLESDDTTNEPASPVETASPSIPKAEKTYSEAEYETLKKENDELKGKVRELESKIKSLKDSILGIIQGI